MGIRVVVVELLCRLLKDGGSLFAKRRSRVRWQMREPRIEMLLGFCKKPEEVAL